MAEPQITTLERPLSRTKEEIIREAKRIEESLLFSSKGHFAAARFWNNFHLWLGIPVVILSAVAGTTAFAKFDSSHTITGIISIVVVALSSIMTFLNPNQKGSNHLNVGNHYDTLMSTVRIFWSVDCWRNEAEDVLTERLKYYSEQKSKLNQSSVQVPKWAYRLAKQGIEGGEAKFEVDQYPTQ